MTTLRPTLAAPKDEAGRSRYRRDAKGHKLYSSRRWRGSDANLGRDGLRWQVLLDAMFTCAMCGRIVSDPSMLVADHIVPHKGDPELFFDRSNLQCLCKDCHDGDKQALDKARASAHPAWLKPSSIPLTIVSGPPASGKSWWVARRAAPGDTIIDLDVIASRLAGATLHGWDAAAWLDRALWERNRMLGNLARPSNRGAAWFIVAEPSARRRDWWVTKLKPEAVVVIEATEAECVENAARDPDRDPMEVLHIATDWWSRYDRRVGDTRLRLPLG